MPARKTKHSRSPLYISLSIVIAVVLWITSGILTQEPKTVKTEIKTIKLTKVRTLQSTAQDRLRMIQLTGVTAPSRRVELKAEVTGRVEFVNNHEGSIIAANDTVLVIENRDRKVRLDEEIAATKRFEIDYNIALKLRKKGFQAENKLAAAAQALAQSRAKQKLAEINLNNSTIKAPFEGILNSVNAEIGDLVGPGISTGLGSINQGSSIATIIDTDPLIITASVSELEISKIKLNVPCEIRLISGKTFEGKVTYISKIAEPITRSFAIEVQFANPNYTIPSGVTAGISVPTDHQKAHLIANSHLSLNKDGDIGVKVLQQEEGDTGIVAFYPVTIFDYDQDGVWIAGLPDKANIITLGQAFVSEGQTAIGVSDE